MFPEFSNVVYLCLLLFFHNREFLDFYTAVGVLVKFLFVSVEFKLVFF